MDNVFIEFLASLFIILSGVMYGGLKNAPSDPLLADPWTQLVPAITLCAVMLCLKDGDSFFPDATPTITLLFWSVGAYDNWIQPFARISGQTLAAGIVLWMCHDISIPSFVSLGRPPVVIFVFEMMGTVIEHMGAVYLFIPMLPSTDPVVKKNLLLMLSRQPPSSASGGGHRVRAKHHHESEPPSLQELMHSSIAFAGDANLDVCLYVFLYSDNHYGAGIHWTLRLCFMSEMNPLVTLVQFTLWNQGWDECIMALWGQAVGVLIAITYVCNYYSPRKQRKPN